jgi:hypothetical protein
MTGTRVAVDTETASLSNVTVASTGIINGPRQAGAKAQVQPRIVAVH